MSNEARDAPFTVTRLTVADAAGFRDLRLDGLRACPEAFGASWEDEVVQSEAQFAARLEHAVLFGTRLDDCAQLAGVVGLHLPEARKVKHKATLWGMYVRPGMRRSGLGTALLGAAIAYAATRVEEIILTVGASNAAAARLYHNAGFHPYGLERRALKVGDRYYDETLMSLVLPTP